MDSLTCCPSYHAGQVATVTNPRGIVIRTTYDALGRATQVIAASTGGAKTNSANITTDYTYDGLGHTTTVTAEQPAGGATPNQTTTYVYGVTTAQGSRLTSNDLLYAVVQPDKATGAYPSPANFAAQRELHAYNALGDLTAKNDGNGTIHYAYVHDVLGRMTDDVIQVLGGGVNADVTRHGTAYDGAGRAYLFTGYNGGGGIVNQVQRTYNGLGQITAEAQQQQSAPGASNGYVTGSSPTVYYAYDEMAKGVNDSRLWGMAYPGGRVVYESYAGSAIDYAISRVSWLQDSDGTGGTPGTILEGYTYLGLDTVVTWSHPQSGVTLTYLLQAGDTAGASSTGGDQYIGLDRFGRVADQNWVKAGATADRFRYGYDRDGDVLYKLNLKDPTQSELYHANSAAPGDSDTAYDNLGRLVAFRRGTLSSSGHNGTTLDTISSPTTAETWSLDALGNQLTVALTTGGTTTTTVRTYNADNQIASVTVNGTAQTAPSYDNDGNTTADGAQTYVYDAWNRLIAAKSGSTYVAIYQYDALGRRVREDYGSAGANTLLYSPGWQVLEERFKPAGGASALKYQYVWGLTYIDDLVLRDTYASGVLSQRLYATHDANYNVTALTSTAGAVQERYLYDPYGAVTYTSAMYAVVSSSASGWRYLHQGGRYDVSTGWYDFRNRDEIASQGRWAERDPMGLGAGENSVYEYEHDSIMGRVDPSGLQDIEIVIQAFIPDKTLYLPGVGTFAGDNRLIYDATPGLGVTLNQCGIQRDLW